MKGKTVKPKGRMAWLVTWEGDEYERSGRPKVVAVLPPQLGHDRFRYILELLYISDYPLTLSEKVAFGLGSDKEKPNYFRYNYRDINVEMFYGDHHCFLRARRVKNLICEDDSNDLYKGTLTWTELQKFAESIDPDEKPKVSLEERQASYTYLVKHPTMR